MNVNDPTAVWKWELNSNQLYKPDIVDMVWNSNNSRELIVIVFAVVVIV